MRPSKGQIPLLRICAKCEVGLLAPRERSCSTCKRRAHEAARRRYYEKNRQAVIERAKAWKQRNPQAVLDSSRRRYARDPERHKKVCEEWRARNPVKVRDIRENRRARERAAFVEEVDRIAVWLAFSGCCGICHEPVALEAMHLDHVVPLSRGGLHAYLNVQPSHETCNKRKHTRLPDQEGACR